MTSTTSTVPDLSLQISPPSTLDCRGLMMIKSPYSDRSSTTDSGSSGGSDLSHENGFCPPENIRAFFSHRPNLSLGLDMMVALNPPPPLRLPGNIKHYQPQIHGRNFKRSSRMMNGVKRSVRAPRMRWTSTLHAHFVHAVQLLGGHESMLIIIQL